MKRYFMALPVHARSVAISLLVLSACVLAYIAIALGSWYLESSARIYDQVPRISRLQGYALNEELLRESAGQVQAQLSEIAYSADEDSNTIGVAIQQQVRRYMESAGFSVSASQSLAPRSHEGFEELRVELTATGPMEALDAVLLELRQARPLLFMHALDISPMRNRRRDDNSQNIIVSFTFSSVKLQ